MGIDEDEIDLPAQLYTGAGKYSTELNLDRIAGLISYYNPERSEMVIIGKGCSMTLKNRGWFFAEFWVSDSASSRPVWRQKLTLYKSDGDKVIQALASDWGRSR